jgi:hypothetical protein
MPLVIGVMIHFIMPPDGLEPRKVDEVFRPQAELLRLRGYTVTLVPDDVFRDDDSPLRGLPQGACVVYRGWMVRLQEYDRLEIAVVGADAKLLTEPSNYALTHHLPNWYPLLAEYTAETVSIRTADELVPMMEQLGWGSYFLKDYVKSLKVAGGSIVRNSADASRWLEKMIEYRDEFEGGICIRRVESFLPESEIRFFILNGTPHSPDERPIPGPVYAAAERIMSRFFTVDIATTTANQTRIVELGDGQVSDLVGWTPERFAEIWSPQ